MWSLVAATRRPNNIQSKSKCIWVYTFCFLTAKVHGLQIAAAQEISEASTKEYAIEVAADEMEHEWKTLSFALNPWTLGMAVMDITAGFALHFCGGRRRQIGRTGTIR